MEYNAALKQIGLFALVTVLVCACAESETQEENTTNFEDLEVLIPEKIREFDHIDTLYYSFLGINTFATEDGGFILPLWDPATLVKTNREGTEVLALTKKGRGPGEVLDTGVPTMGENEIYVYDQNQQKIVIYNSEDFSLISEFLVESYSGYRVSRVYPAFEDGNVLLELGNSRLEIDKMEDKLLARYNSESGEYEELIAIKGKTYAPMSELIDGMSGTAKIVPYSDSQLIFPASDRKTILLYDTRTNQIAEVNAGFDTLRTIAVELPIEEVSSAEKDSIKAEVEAFHSADWSAVEPYIPENKATADDMLYYNNKIWLKSNLSGDGDLWFVLNMDGKITDLVSLPKNTYLTHVSEHHLGVRLDEVTFALYENPVGD